MKTTLPASPHRRAPYRIRGTRVWACLRARYLAGESAPTLAVAFDVSVYAIRRRITREGWSKRGLAEAEEAACPDVGAEASAPPPLRGPPPHGHGEETHFETRAEGDPLPLLEPRAAARAALDEAVRLLRIGRLGAAEAAARVADVMGRAAARLEAAEPAAVEAGVDEAAFEAVRRKVLGLPPPPGEE